MSEASVPYKAFPLSDKPLPPLVYHYSDFQGINGILSSGGFWATDIRHLNDHTEYQFGLDRAVELVASARPSEAVRRGRSDEELGEMLQNLIDLLARGASKIIDDLVYGVICFCESPDQLSQWRGYGRGTGGYSVGFDAAELRAELSNVSLPLFPVCYEAADYREGLSAGFLHQVRRDRHLVDNLEEMERAEAIDAITDYLSATTELLIGACSQIKHPSFYEEQEWRVCDIQHPDSPQVKFRSGGLGATPYIEINACSSRAKLPIAEIVVGPGGNFATRARAISLLLTHHGYQPSDVEIRSSTIPFR